MSAPARAESMQVSVISPTSGSSFATEAPFTLELQFLGGAVASAPDCSALNEVIAVGVVGASGAGLYWSNSSWEFVEINPDWNTKLLPHGVDCSMRFAPQAPTVGDHFAGNSGYSDDLKSEIVSPILGFPIAADAAAMGSATHMVIAVGNRLDLTHTPDQVLSIPLTAVDEPSVSIVGLQRGDVIDLQRTFQVVAKLPPGMKPDHLDPRFSGGGSVVCQPLQTTSTTATGSVYIAQCQLQSAWDAQSPTPVEVYLDTTDQQLLQAPVVNVSTTPVGFPNVQVSGQGWRYAPRSQTGSRTTIRARLTGSISVNAIDRYRNQSPDSALSFSACFNGVCTPLALDSAGNFTASGDIRATNINFVIKGMYKGAPVLVLKSSSQTDTSTGGPATSDALFAGSIHAHQKKPPLVNPVKITRVTFPTTVRWGQGFTLSISAAGSGGASCVVYFQETLSRGQYSVRIVAGTTVRIRMATWYHGLQAWPLHMLCRPDNWPNSASALTYDLGSITIK